VYRAPCRISEHRLAGELQPELGVFDMVANVKDWVDRAEHLHRLDTVRSHPEW
jgi:hypothetical protein